MKKVLKLIAELYKYKSLQDPFSSNVSYEFTLEKDIITCQKTNKVFLLVKSISRSIGTKLEIDELINNQYVVNKLDRDSLKFLFYTAGLLEGLKQNDIYTISELDPLDPNVIIVKNVITFQEEIWNIFESYDKKFYHKLDKESITKFIEIYLACKKNSQFSDQLRIVK